MKKSRWYRGERKKAVLVACVLGTLLILLVLPTPEAKSESLITGNFFHEGESCAACPANELYKQIDVLNSTLEWYKQKYAASRDYNEYIRNYSEHIRNRSETVKENNKVLRAELEKQSKIQSALTSRLVSEVNLWKACRSHVFPRCPSSAQRIELDQCSGSMRPTFSCYDDIMAFKPASASDVNLCDVITFDVPEKVPTTEVTRITDEGTEHFYEYFGPRITHRIIGLNGSLFLTKGDASPVIDPYQPVFSDVRYVICRA